MRIGMRLGATRRFPEGRLDQDDEGEPALAVGSNFIKGKVIVQFGTPVTWLAMGPEKARELASQLLHHAEMIA